MKKTNFKKLSVFFAFIFGAFLFVACGQTRGNVTFKDTQIQMAYGEEINIADLVVLDGLNIGSVVFESSNPEIVLVTPRQTIVAGEEDGVAILSAQGYNGYLEIQVLGTNLAFSAPTNVHYEQSSGLVMWDSVYAGNVVANNYTIKVTHNGEAFEPQTINSASYQIIGEGVFEVEVSCNAKSGVQASPFSQKYTFTKLASPLNVQYNSNTGLLEWQAPEGITHFYVKKDGVLSEKLTETSFALNLTETKTHEISVVSAGEAEQENVFGSSSEVLSLTRLVAPEISVSNGVVTWQDEQAGVAGYAVSISAVSGGEQNQILSEVVLHNGAYYAYKLPSLEAGEYVVNVGALGSNSDNGIYVAGTHFLNSALAQTEKTEKLESKDLVFDKSTKTISVKDFDLSLGLNLQLVAQKQGEDANVIDISSGNVVFDFADAGVYSFYLLNVSKTDKEITSEAGEPLTVIKLAEISTITQTEDSAGEYVLNGLTLEHATKFDVSVAYEGGNPTKLTLNDGNYGLTSSIFAGVGNYAVNVVAFGTDADNFYVLESTTTLQVVRLKTNTLSRNGEKIEWATSGSLADIAYSYSYTGADEQIGMVQTNSFDLTPLVVGSYDFTVKAVGLNKTNAKILVLDAFNSETVAFEIKRPLAQVPLALERSATGYNLVITPVENATTYTITLNSQPFKVENYTGTENIVIAVESCFASAGAGINMLNYNFEVCATNSQNTYYEPSPTSIITVKKELAPTKFTVSSDEVVSTDKELSHIQDVEVLINDIATNMLDANTNTFNVKIRYIAKSQNYDGVYYIDSDYAEFKLERLQVAVKVYGLKAYWSVGTTTQAYTPYLNFEQGAKTYSLNLTYFPMVDLEEFKIERFGFSLDSALNGYVECAVGKFSADIAGEYVNGKFVSGNGGALSTYHVGGKSKATVLQNANTNINIGIAEQDGKVNVSWTAKENAEYSLFDGTDEVTGLNNSANIDASKLAKAGKYNLSLEEIVDNKTYIYVFYLNRLSAVESLTILSDETFKAELIAGAKAVEIKQGDLAILNLKNVQTDATTISVRYIAKDPTNACEFYLNSDVTTYSFARLSALNTVSNLNIYENVISWTKEGSADVSAYVYNVKFFDQNSNEEVVTLQAQTANSIDLATEEYQTILAKLSGIKYISIEKYVGEFVANGEAVNYLTSPYSAEVALKIIDAPTNVKIELAEDASGVNAIVQSALTISWTVNQEGVEIAGYTVEITHNGKSTTYESSAVFTVDATSELFKDEGQWSVRVRALGANDSILSEFSESVSVLRLKASAGLVLTKTGVISWNKVDNALQYMIAYACNGGTDTIMVANNTLSSEGFKTVLENEFAGTINLSLYALGDGETTLTSQTTASYTRLEKPVITYENDRIVLENYSTYPANTKLFATATINGNVVISKEISLELDDNKKYVWYYPTEFSYVDENGQTVAVDSSTQQDINFVFEACNSGLEYLNSNKVSQKVTILSPLSDLRMVRSEAGMIKLLATNTNSSVVTAKVNLNDNVWLFNGNVELELSDRIIENIPTSWTFAIQAIGGNSDSNIYINSKVAYISGTKLGTVQGITTTDGKITWNQVTGASDYKMCVDYTTYLSGYFATRQESLFGANFASGDHVLCIRALGNIGTTPINAGIVLDGDYSSDYTVTKLEALSDFTVENGFFTFTSVQKASEYVIRAYTDLDLEPIAEYSLAPYNVFPNQTNANGYYYSAQLLSKLDELSLASGNMATLYIRIYNKTTQENYVYSDYASVAYGSGTYDYVTIARVQNLDAKINLYHPTKPDGENIDYTSTIASWQQNMVAPNNYLLNIDGVLSVSSANTLVLDEDCSWSVGGHTISHAQLGSQGFDASGLAYLTANFSQTINLTKLEEVTPYLANLGNETRELCITYSTVTGANKYISYLDGEYFGEYSNAGIAIMMDTMKDGYVYENFAMRAVNTNADITYLASNYCYLKHYDSEEDKVKVVSIAKTKAPAMPTFNDGAFYWEFTDNEWLTMLSDQDKIYTWNKLSLSFGQLLTSQFLIKFTSRSAPITSYVYLDYVRNYIYVSEEQFETLCGYIDTLAPTLDLSDEQVYLLKQNLLKYFKGGFASANHNFSTFASSLPSGDYTVEIKTVGSGLVIYEDTREYEAWFSSNYANIGVKFIASAPSVTAVALSGKYSLKFTNVNVDSSYFASGISYKLFGTYYDEEYDLNRTELVTTLDYASLNNSAQIAFDLTELIKNDVLNSKYVSMFVTVAGNDGNLLNGKTSNIINIQILNAVTAKVERGIIYWSAQEFASKYQAVYLKAGESEAKYLDFAVEAETEWYYWTAGELDEATTYTVSLQACGLIDASINNSETFIMSGKVTPIGTVNKLAGISNVENGVDIENGLFVWPAIENATAYDVYRFSSADNVLYVETVGNNNFYETTATNLEKYDYYFMSIGTEMEDLTEESNIFVNSNLSSKNTAQRLGDIRSVSYDNALISFTPVYKTGYYKLTFYKVNSKGERSEAIVVYTTETNFDTNSNESLLAAGRYEVEIQAVYKDKTLVETTSDCYYVIGSKNTTWFYKFDKVYNVKVGEYDIPSGAKTIHYDGGVISWAHDNTESMALDTFEYKLVFKAYSENGTFIGETVKVVPSTQKYFEGVVFDSINATDNITLEIFVYPTAKAMQTSINYVHSASVTYGVYANDIFVEPTYLHQYMQIDESKLSIGITEKSQLKIDWTQGISGSNTGDFMYEISFSIGGVEQAPMTTNQTYLIIGDEDEGLFADDSATTVVLKIRVIPTSENYISSAWTSSKEIARPESVTNLAYDETNYTVTWDQYASSENWDSYKYKIRDEVTYVDVNGDRYVEVYIITASLGDERYQPFVIGSHKISVAVMVSSSDQDNSDFISAYKTLEDIQFNIFEMGAGTEENPYVVLDQTQFANMQYRMQKDAKNNEYYLTREINGELSVDNQKITDALTGYYFRQDAHITLVKNGTVDQTLYNNETAFENTYDGNKYSLTLAYTHIDDTTDYEHVSIFKTLGQKAVIKNVKLLFEFTATDNSLKGSGDWADISVLCEQNNGTIENIAIGNTGDELKINTVYLIFSLSMLTSSNYGTITNVQNNYNVTLEDKNVNVQQQINYAPMAINNYGTIMYAKNNGNITISASNLFVGGLVVVNDGANAKIIGGANKGNFDIFYKTSDSSYVGGLVAKNTANASLSYCYNIGGVSVSSASGVLPTGAYVGGLVGWSAYDAISNSYVNAVIATSITNFNVYQLIGFLQGSQSYATNVYYNANIAVTAIRGTTGAGVKSYTTSPLDCELYGSGTLFNKADTEGNNPRLDWEAKLFETIEWRDILPVG